MYYRVRNDDFRLSPRECGVIPICALTCLASKSSSIHLSGFIVRPADALTLLLNAGHAVDTIMSRTDARLVDMLAHGTLPICLCLLAALSHPRSQDLERLQARLRVEANAKHGEQLVTSLR